LPAVTADHNLLVGVLALQLNFLGRDELIQAACDATGGAKSEPLIDVFRRRGRLSADDCDLLMALVSRHLARHNNDPLQSLAHCDAAGSVRKLLGVTVGAPAAAAVDTVAYSGPHADPHMTRRDDPFVTTAANGTAGSHGEAPPSAGAPTMPYSPAGDSRATTVAFAAPVASNAPLSQPAVTRFRIIRPFQKGGLGQVSLARDAELNREVALKEILPKHADNADARQRFLVEAEITGSLEHPGVVPVYGLGHYGDGRPFYAMRLIRGDNLQLAIDEYHRQRGAADRELRFRQLLGRFVDVCNAIEYAHNRCVLHRDLKPGNIMLGKYGETLVVDWGLAKAIGTETEPCETKEAPVRPVSAESSTQTQMGSIVGTPAYMSPEQASGRVDQLGPAADIYSLGATLYHLLVGRAPFASQDWDELIGNVQMGRFEAPRSVNQAVPKPLEAVCLKAMARRPADRYVSARALADDIERFLADEPVAAFRESLAARIGRWMRKHRAAVLAVGGIVTAIAMSLGIGVVLLNAANERSEHNFEMARKAISDYYITVSEETLLDQPGMQPLRDQLLRQALKYYQQFLATEQRDDELLDELAQANYFAGSITESIKSPAEAIPYYKRAVDLNARLVARSPDNDSAFAAQARTLNALGGSMQKLQRLEDSRNYYLQAEAIRQRLVDKNPDDPEFARTLANTIMNLGTIEALSGDAKLAFDRWQKAQEIRTRHLTVGAESVKLRADAGKGDFNLGLFHLNEGDVAKAEQHLKQAVDSFERVRRQAPNDLQSQFRLAETYRTLGDLQADAGGIASARPLYDKAFDLLTTLNLRNPQVADYKATLGAMQTSVAELLLADGQIDEGLIAINKSIGPLEELVDQHPDMLLHQRDWAVALRVRAELQLEQGDRSAAAADAARAVGMLSQLIELEPTDSEFRQQLQTAEETLANAQ
jgi:serine/threonine-protein kinase